MAVSTCIHCTLRFARRAELSQHLVHDHSERIAHKPSLATLPRELAAQ